jgi:hypothetical protein
MIAVPAQTHTLNSTLTPFPLINPNSRLPFPRHILRINPDTLNNPLSRSPKHDMTKIMLLTLNHPKSLLKLRNPLLQIIMKDQMTQRVFQPVLARLQRNPLPMLPLILLTATPSRRQSRHVMFFQQCFTLIPCAAPRSMEESLSEKFFENLVLAFMLLEPAERVQAFVDDSGKYPCWREPAKISAFAAFVDAVFFLLFLVD